MLYLWVISFNCNRQIFSRENYLSRIHRWYTSKLSITNILPLTPTFFNNFFSIPSEREPISQATFRLGNGSSTFQIQTLFFSIHEVPHLQDPAEPRERTLPDEANDKRKHGKHRKDARSLTRKRSLRHKEAWSTLHRRRFAARPRVRGSVFMELNPQSLHL